MKFGIWTPLPHTIRPEPRMDRAIAEIKSGTSLAGRTDGTFEFAYDVVRRADELGFDTTLIAERFLGPDLSAWVLASALAMVTKRHGRRASRHGNAAGGRKNGLEPGPHQPWTLCPQHRQWLVDGGV